MQTGACTRHGFGRDGVIGRALEWLGAHAPPILALGVFIGLAWPALAAWLRPILVPAIFVILTLSLLRLEWDAIAAHGRRPLVVAAALLWLLGVCPIVMWLAVGGSGLPAGLTAALVLKVMAPPVTAGVALALLLGLDAPLAILLSVVALAVVPATLPPGALALLGLEIDISLPQLMGRMALLVAGAGVGAFAIRRFLPPGWATARAARIDGWNVVFFVLFAVAIMDGVTATLLDRPGLVLLYAGAAFAANLGFQLLGGLAFWWLDRRRALTIALASGNRNLALPMAVLVDSAGFDVLLYFAVGQLPIYILPVVLAPLYRRLLRPSPRGGEA